MDEANTTETREVTPDKSKPPMSGSTHNANSKSMTSDTQATNLKLRRKRCLQDNHAKVDTKFSRSNQEQHDVTVARKLDPETTLDGEKDTTHSFEVNNLHPDDLAQTKTLHIDDLPPAMLLNVFGYLSMSDLLHRASPVCHSWYTLVYDPSLWRRICLRKLSKTISDEVLEKLTSLSENVNYLDISDKSRLSGEGVAAALKNCPQLQTLRMSRCTYLDSPAFNGISANCASLKQLYMEGCYLLTDDDLTKVAQGCPKLELLRINQCSAITTKGIEAVAANCPDLKQLTMDQCLKVTDPAMRAIVRNCKRLQTISCMSCGLTGEGVALLREAKELRFMEVSNIRSVTNQNIIDVVSHCPNLESINLSLCKSINDTCVDFMVRNLKLLKRLYLVSCDLSSKSLYSMAEHGKVLEIVDVGWCNGITDDGVCAISSQCITLQYLGLMCCDQVTIPMTKDLVEKYPNITYSTKYLDCIRLLETARRQGVPITIPDLSAPALS